MEKAESITTELKILGNFISAKTNPHDSLGYIHFENNFRSYFYNKNRINPMKVVTEGSSIGILDGNNNLIQIMKMLG